MQPSFPSDWLHDGRKLCVAPDDIAASQLRMCLRQRSPSAVMVPRPSFPHILHRDGLMNRMASTDLMTSFGHHRGLPYDVSSVDMQIDRLERQRQFLQAECLKNTMMTSQPPAAALPSCLRLSTLQGDYIQNEPFGSSHGILTAAQLAGQSMTSRFRLPSASCSVKSPCPGFRMARTGPVMTSHQNSASSTRTFQAGKPLQTVSKCHVPVGMIEPVQKSSQSKRDSNLSSPVHKKAYTTKEADDVSEMKCYYAKLLTTSSGAVREKTNRTTKSPNLPLDLSSSGQLGVDTNATKSDECNITGNVSDVDSSSQKPTPNDEAAMSQDNYLDASISTATEGDVRVPEVLTPVELPDSPQPPTMDSVPPTEDTQDNDKSVSATSSNDVIYDSMAQLPTTTADKSDSKYETEEIGAVCDKTETETDVKRDVDESTCFSEPEFNEIIQGFDKQFPCVDNESTTSFEANQTRDVISHNEEDESVSIETAQYSDKLSFVIASCKTLRKKRLLWCIKCAKKFKKRTKFLRHWLVHFEGLDILECDSCSFLTLYKKELKMHMTAEHYVTWK